MATSRTNKTSTSSRKATADGSRSDVESSAANLPATGTSAASASADVREPVARAVQRVSPRKSAGPKFPSRFAKSQSVAHMCTGTDPQADRLRIAFDQPLLDVTLSAGTLSLLAGPWEAATIVEGDRRTALAGQWEWSCWNADEDADYLELQLEFSEGMRLERQILLSRGGQFALFADCVLQAGPGPLEYRSQFHTASGVTARLAPGSRGVDLRRGTTRVARCCPLFLPQQTVEATAGSVMTTPTGWEMRNLSAGASQFVPMVVDWHPQRLKETCAWTPLTVTEDRVELPGDVARAFRLRLGTYQLAIYRSLIRSEVGRAFLGHHTRFETLVGAIEPTGLVDQILAILGPRP